MPKTTVASDDEEPKPGCNKNPVYWIVRIAKNITVEPVLACWILPALFLFVAMENLGLEKSCRVNLALDDFTCANMIDRSLNDIDCSEFEAEAGDVPGNTETPIGIRKLDDIGMIDFIPTLNETAIEIGSKFGEYELELENATDFVSDVAKNISAKFDFLIDDNLPSDRKVSGDELKMLTARVCKAELDSQKLISVINAYRAPIAQIFPIIIILFAGGWSDKKQIRKPCMLFPLIGELLGCTALFISSIFMRQLPMEFGSILEKVLPAMFGGQTLMIMGFYSYLTAVTKEEDRTFRFTCFAVFFTIVTIVGIPFSGDLYNVLGYTKLFLFCIIVYIIGIFYIIFGLKEVVLDVDHSKEIKEGETGEEKRTNGTDNPTFDATENAMELASKRDTVKIEDKENGVDIVDAAKKAGGVEEKKNFFVEFFDPALAIACITVFTKKRENNGRLILFLLAACYFIFIAPAFGEGDYLYVFTRLKLNWDGVKFSHYNTYNSVMGLVGTSFLTGVVSKFFRVSDPMIGMISSACSIVAKPMFALATASITFYIASTIDMFIGTRAIAMKSILSRFVEADELGRVYSILGILDAFAGFIIPTIYSVIYLHTVEFFPGAFYMFGVIFMVASFVIFFIVYVIFKRNPLKKIEEGDTENGLEVVDLQDQKRKKSEPVETYTHSESTNM